MAVAEALTTEDRIRGALRAYEQANGIGQSEHSRRLGLPHSTLSRFYSDQYPISARIVRAFYSFHVAMRPLLHEWLSEHGQDEGAE